MNILPHRTVLIRLRLVYLLPRRGPKLIDLVVTSVRLRVLELSLRCNRPKATQRGADLLITLPILNLILYGLLIMGSVLFGSLERKSFMFIPERHVFDRQRLVLLLHYQEVLKELLLIVDRCQGEIIRY